jgi:hypothetical protein
MNQHQKLLQHLASESAWLRGALALDPRVAMLDDMRRVSAMTPVVTRNFYRGHGRFREAEWQYFWSTFKEFLKAADNYIPVCDACLNTK